MATLLEVTEINQGRDCDVDEIGTRKYHRVFRCAYDDATPGPGQAILDQFVRRYSFYSEPGGFVDEAALAIKATSAPEDPETSFNHLVTVYYTTRWWDEVERALLALESGLTGPRPHGGGGEKPEDNSPANPLARPWKIKWGHVSIRELMERDRDPTSSDGGFLIRTTAGVPYDPPLESERKLLTCTIERNTAQYFATNAQFYFNKTNDNSIRLGGQEFPAGTVKCEYWTGETAGPENGIVYWSQTLYFIINFGFIMPAGIVPAALAGQRSGWLRVLLNAGLQELRGGKLVDIKHQGHPVSKPWPLDIAGQALPEGYAETDLIYRTYVEFPQVDFTDMGLR